MDYTFKCRECGCADNSPDNNGVITCLDCGYINYTAAFITVFADDYDYQSQLISEDIYYLQEEDSE